MSRRDSDMSSGSFISFILMLLLVTISMLVVISKIHDLQHRVGQLEERVRR